MVGAPEHGGIPAHAPVPSETSAVRLAQHSHFSGEGGLAAGRRRPTPAAVMVGSEESREAFQRAGIASEP